MLASTVVKDYSPLIAATVTGIVAVIVLWINGLRAERARRRELYAAASEVTFAYREFAYAVPRRRHDAPSEERVRLSEAMREVQRDLMHYQTLLSIEPAKAVADAYAELVSQTRKIAGQHIHNAWKAPAITDDAQMNVHSPLDFSAINPFHQNYLDAARRDLAWWRFLRWRTGRLSWVRHPGGW